MSRIYELLSDLNAEWLMRAWAGDVGDELDEKYPSASMEIDAEWLVMYGPFFDNEALGALMHYLCRSVAAGHTDLAESLPFVRRVRLRPSGCRPAIPVAVKDDVLSGDCCVVCGSAENLEIDHIIPVSRGGTNDRENLQLLCRTCNRSKWAYTMEEWRSSD